MNNVLDQIIISLTGIFDKNVSSGLSPISGKQKSRGKLEIFQNLNYKEKKQSVKEINTANAKQ
jgi:hypothetical protein